MPNAVSDASTPLSHGDRCSPGATGLVPALSVPVHSVMPTFSLFEFSTQLTLPGPFPVGSLV